MILTGPRIRENVETGKELHGKPLEIYSIRGKYVHPTKIVDMMDHIHVDPYDPELVGPNSIDLRLGDSLLVYESGMSNHIEQECERKAGNLGAWNRVPRPLDMRAENPTKELGIPEEGIVLHPGVLYLGRTIECIGSNSFVPIVEGRSSVGRLGIHVHVTAGFCDLGFKGTITLEIHVIHPVRIYAGVAICQAYFLKPEGAIELYKGRYQGQVDPTASRFSQDKNPPKVD